MAGSLQKHNDDHVKCVTVADTGETLLSDGSLMVKELEIAPDTSNDFPPLGVGAHNVNSLPHVPQSYLNVASQSPAQVKPPETGCRVGSSAVRGRSSSRTSGELGKRISDHVEIAEVSRQMDEFLHTLPRQFKEELGSLPISLQGQVLRCIERCGRRQIDRRFDGAEQRNG